MSQEKLGKHLDLTFQQVQKYEKGAHRLFDLTKVPGVPVQFLYDEALSRTQSAGAATPGFTEQTDEIFIGLLDTREGLELSKAFVSIIIDPIFKEHRSIVDLVRALAGEES